MYIINYSPVKGVISRGTSRVGFHFTTRMLRVDTQSWASMFLILKKTLICRVCGIVVKSLDPLRAKKTFIRKKLGHTMVSVIKASSVTLKIWQNMPEENSVNLQFATAVVSKFWYVEKYQNISNLLRK